MKGRITMSIKETERIAIVGKLIDKKITTLEASKMIGVTTRQVRRIKARYIKEGARGLVHKLRGRQSNKKIDKKELKRAMRIVQEQYSDFGPTLAHEKLVENHRITFSKETLRKQMIKEGIWKVKRRRKKTHHPMRERRACEGELIQIDGSPEYWFEDRADKCNLNIAIDDATGKIMAGIFTPTETTESYIRMMTKYINSYGRPLAIYADRHSIFRVNNSNKGSASRYDEINETQFQRILRELDIELISAYSPQAKGRVERAFETLQDRLIKEMRLEGISSIKEGNKFLTSYFKTFNSKFAVKPTSEKDVHRELLPGTELETIMCLKEQRVISKNLTFQYKNVLYQLDVKKGHEYIYRKSDITILEKLDKKLDFKYMGHPIEVKVVKRNRKSKVATAKEINHIVEKAKDKKAKVFKFKILGRTFLFGRKPDIFNLP